MNNDEKILKILETVAANMATVLSEQQAQRTDIRSLHTDMQSLHTEIHESKAELASKADVQDLQATLVKQIKSQERRINTLEDEAGIPHPNKN